MEGKNKKNRPVSWFWRWFLNNQVVTALLVVLLIFGRGKLKGDEE